MKKKPEDGSGNGGGVIVMKKLTTRGLQALAGGPSRLRSVKGAPATPTPGVAAAAVPNEAPKMRAPVDSMAEVTLPRETVAPIQLATDDELDQATLLLEESAPKLRDEEIETLLQESPLSSPRPAAGLAAAQDARVERTAILEAPKVAAAAAMFDVAEPPAPKQKHQMSLRTPPTLIHQQSAIPDEIRQLAIRALEMQKTQASSSGAGLVSPPASQPAQAKSAVSPAPQKPQPGAPAVVKSGGKVQIVVRETKRRTAFGWTAMLLALGVFVGLSTVAVIHGDAKHAWNAAKNYASQKRPEPAPPVVAAAPAAPAVQVAQAPAADPVAAAPAPVPAPADPVAAPDTRIADNKPSAGDVKDDAKASPKPDPKPEVTKPDPAPRPQQKPSNAYASTKVASGDDRPAPAPRAAKPKPDPEPVVAATPKPKPEPVAAKPKPEKDPVATAKPDPKPAPKGDDDVAKISQMAQQQLGAALP